MVSLLLFSVGMTFSSLLYAQDYVPGEVIVKFKSGTSVQNFNASSGRMMGLSHRGGWSSMNLHQYSLPAGTTMTASISELSANPDVEYVEPNYILRKSSDEPVQVLSRQDLESLGGISILAGSFTQTGAGIQAEDAWAVAVGTGMPVVAVIDSGMDLTHSALQDALWVNSGEIANNGVDDDNNGYIDDVNGWDFVDNDKTPNDGDGHGTHVAGIIRGTSQNLFATPTETPLMKLMPVRFLNNSGSGSTSNAIKAIYYAVNNGAKVLNNSWGGSSFSRALLEAIAFSYDQHTIFVAAAGNSSANNDVSPMYPASYDVPNILSVAATTDADTRAGFSNYGANSVHVASPGVAIQSTYKLNSYTPLSGTSMATPFVAGIAAMILREQPTMWGYQVKQVIVAGAESKAALSGIVSTSARVNVLNAVTGAQAAALNFSQPGYSIAVSSADRSLASNISGGGCGRVQKMYQDFNNKQGRGSGGVDFGFLLLMAVPFAIMAYRARTQKSPGFKRKYERFSIESSMKMKVGDKVFEGTVDTISLGGAAINVAAALESGSLLTLTIASSDGKESVTVQGKVVWKAESESYGVSFAHLDEKVQSTIQSWTAGLAAQKSS
ncbi:MAG: S8 family serine peptidase [Bdellovibrionales bacterium]